MALDKISTPAGCIIKTSSGNAKLEWNSGFASQQNEVFSKQQKFIDSEVLRLCSPLVPFDTGMLEKSGTLGTTIGSGEVDYIAVYAAYQYYSTSQSRSYDSNRGAQWFERMKASNKEDILEAAKKLG